MFCVHQCCGWHTYLNSGKSVQWNRLVAPFHFCCGVAAFRINDNCYVYCISTVYVMIITQLIRCVCVIVSGTFEFAATFGLIIPRQNWKQFSFVVKGRQRFQRNVWKWRTINPNKWDAMFTLFARWMNSNTTQAKQNKTEEKIENENIVHNHKTFSR